MSPDVVSDQDSSACSYRIDSADDFRFGELAYPQREMLGRVRARGTDEEDPVLIVWIDLDVDRKRRQVGQESPSISRSIGLLMAMVLARCRSRGHAPIGPYSRLCELPGLPKEVELR